MLGDHAQAGQIVEADAVVPGFATKLITREGSTLQVSYATSTNLLKQGHTGTQVRVAAYGPEGHRVEGLIDQTEVFAIMTRALGLN
ncbi:MAG: alkaline phosphatase [Actinomycetota bacterium]|nr:alkaline phosphatase [Actinomycetota bacterium]